MPGGVWIVSAGCLDGVCGCLWVSGSYLGVCSRCLGENRCHINHNHQLNRSCHIKLLPFLHSQKVLDCWVSVGGLEGVWRVSGGYLGDSGYCQGGYNAKSIGKFPTGIVLISSASSFSPSCLQMVKNGENSKK